MRLAAAFALVLLIGGCTNTNTLFPVAGRYDAPREFVLDIPDNLEVRSVDFEAATDSSGVRGRGIVKVIAVNRETGEQVLLLYENLEVRTEPTTVIRFR